MQLSGIYEREKTMKKILSLVLICTTLVFVAPKPEAKAGVIVGGVVGLLNTMNGEIFNPNVLIPIGIMGTGMALIKFAGNTNWGIGAGLMLVILDADKTSNAQNLSPALANQYPFLDNQEVLNTFSEVIMEKYHAENTGKDFTTISLSAEELADILSPLDLKSFEMEVLINDFK